jgi:hypothetical protein
VDGQLGILSGKYTIPTNNKYDNHIIQLLKSMLTINVNQRVNIQQIQLRVSELLKEPYIPIQTWSMNISSQSLINQLSSQFNVKQLYQPNYNDDNTKPIKPITKTKAIDSDAIHSAKSPTNPTNLSTSDNIKQSPIANDSNAPNINSIPGLNKSNDKFDADGIKNKKLSSKKPNKSVGEIDKSSHKKKTKSSPNDNNNNNINNNNTSADGISFNDFDFQPSFPPVLLSPKSKLLVTPNSDNTSQLTHNSHTTNNLDNNISNSKLTVLTTNQSNSVSTLKPQPIVENIPIVRNNSNNNPDNDDKTGVDDSFPVSITIPSSVDSKSIELIYRRYRVSTLDNEEINFNNETPYEIFIANPTQIDVSALIKKLTKKDSTLLKSKYVKQLIVYSWAVNSNNNHTNNVDDISFLGNIIGLPQLFEIILSRPIYKFGVVMYKSLLLLHKLLQYSNPTLLEQIFNNRKLFLDFESEWKNKLSTNKTLTIITNDNPVADLLLEYNKYLQRRIYFLYIHRQFEGRDITQFYIYLFVLYYLNHTIVHQ